VRTSLEASTENLWRWTDHKQATPGKLLHSWRWVIALVPAFLCVTYSRYPSQEGGAYVTTAVPDCRGRRACRAPLGVCEVARHHLAAARRNPHRLARRGSCSTRSRSSTAARSACVHLRTWAGFDAARARGHTDGRPPALSDADKQAARVLLKDPSIPVEDVAKRLHASPATAFMRVCGLYTWDV